MRTLIPGFTTTRIDYSSTDGTPGVEGDLHREVLHDVWQRLKSWAKGQRNCYIGSALCVYYSEDEPQVQLAPDAFVAFGVSSHARKYFKTWVERVVPAVVFEITSRSTLHADLVTKMAIYRDVWAVDEYYLFDPLEDHLDPSLQGFRRARGAFQPIRPNKDGSLTSRRLGLTLARGGDQLTLHDTATGAMVLTEHEAEITRLKAEIEALKKK